MLGDRDTFGTRMRRDTRMATVRSERIEGAGRCIYGGWRRAWLRLCRGGKGGRNGWVGRECKNRFGGLQGWGLEVGKGGEGDWCGVVWVDVLMGCARARGPRRGWLVGGIVGLRCSDLGMACATTKLDGDDVGEWGEAAGMRGVARLVVRSCQAGRYCGFLPAGELLRMPVELRARDWAWDLGVWVFGESVLR